MLRRPKAPLPMHAPHRARAPSTSSPQGISLFLPLSLSDVPPSSLPACLAPTLQGAARAAHSSDVRLAKMSASRLTKSFLPRHKSLPAAHPSGRLHTPPASAGLCWPQRHHTRAWPRAGCPPSPSHVPSPVSPCLALSPLPIIPRISPPYPLLHLHLLLAIPAAPSSLHARAITRGSLPTGKHSPSRACPTTCPIHINTIYTSCLPSSLLPTLSYTPLPTASRTMLPAT